MENIILIGMPGAGKSTVGVVLAKRMGYRFMDTDIVIQEQVGMLLNDIIAQRGTEGFKETENSILSHIKAEKTVIATGGSAVYGKEAMANLKNLGKVVYLKQSCRSISNRLGNLSKRGVAMKKGQTLRQLYDERTPLYEKYADIVIDCGKKTISRIAGEIEDRIYKLKIDKVP